MSWQKVALGLSSVNLTGKWDNASHMPVTINKTEIIPGLVKFNFKSGLRSSHWVLINSHS